MQCKCDYGVSQYMKVQHSTLISKGVMDFLELGQYFKKFKKTWQLFSQHYMYLETFDYLKINHALCIRYNCNHFQFLVYIYMYIF